MKKISLMLIALQWVLLSFGQESFQTMQQIVYYTDSLYGSNDMLIRGKYYTHKSMRAVGHPYFLSARFEPAVVYIQKHRFRNVQLQYNIEDDIFILTSKLQSGQPAFMELNRSVDSIDFMGSRFVSAHKLGVKGLDAGYYEQITTDNFLFLIKYYKNAEVVHLQPKKYSKIFRHYYILENGEWIKVSSKKSFTSYFGVHKSTIRKYFRKNNIKYKTCNRKELIGLIKYSNELQKK